MGPGQPGIALGGLFYLLLALLGPFVELARALRGRSTAASRRVVARHFALAATMLVALDLAYRAATLLFAPSADAPAEGPAAPSAKLPSEGLVALPVTPVLLGLALLATVLAAPSSPTSACGSALRRAATAAGRSRRRRSRRPETEPLQAAGAVRRLSRPWWKPHFPGLS